MSEYNIEQRPSIHRRLMRLSGLLHRRAHLMRMQRGPMGDTSRGQGRVLTLLRMQPEISQKDLGYLLDMRPQSLGELLSKLEAAGYIKRTPSDADRRAMNVELTEQGREAAEKAGERGGESDSLYGCLSDEERQNLAEYLDKLIAALESQLGDERGEGGWGVDGHGFCHGDWHGHGHGHGRGGFGGPGGREGHRGEFNGRERPGFGPDGMRTDGEFREL